MGQVAFFLLFFQLPGDVAVLATEEARQDLPCRVTPQRPALGFDLALHAGYTVRIPRRELPEGRLRLLARITPLASPGEPVYLRSRLEVPAGSEDVLLCGRFAVAQGRYRVDWMLRDQSERVCSAHWEFSAEPPRGVELLPPLDEEAPLVRVGSLHLRVLLHLAPQHPGAATLDPGEIDDLVAMVRVITREPRIGRLSIVALQPAQQRIVFRQEDTPRLDFPGLRDALARVDFVRVDYRRLLPQNAEGPADATVALEPPLLRYAGRVYHAARPAGFAAAWRDIRSRLATLPTAPQ